MQAFEGDKDYEFKPHKHIAIAAKKCRRNIMRENLQGTCKNFNQFGKNLKTRRKTPEEKMKSTQNLRKQLKKIKHCWKRIIRENVVDMHKIMF